jgi:hypothetical protein
VAVAVHQWDVNDWGFLLDRIGDLSCTAFIGAGVSPNPLAARIADEWAETYGYPLEDRLDLARVAQYVSVVQGDAVAPKDRVVKMFRATLPPSFDDPREPHALLADLPLAVYITTNYDGFMAAALRSRGRQPTEVLCRWNSQVPRSRPHPPSPAEPWVFHFHGSQTDVASIVLTEDDYIDFLVSVQQDEKVLPPAIRVALCNTSLLFIGYSLSDLTFRVLFRGLLYTLPAALQRRHLAVQLPPGDEKAAEYLEQYFDRWSVKVFWGTAQEFTAELRDRWEHAHGRLGAS